MEFGGNLKTQHRSQNQAEVETGEINKPTPLVGSSYLDWVDEEVGSDRLIYLTHPECASCKQIDPIFNNLAELALSRADLLSFASMSCDKNDPPADVEAHNYPKIMYYQADADSGLDVRPSQLFGLASLSLAENLDSVIGDLGNLGFRGFGD